jgi:Arc/MetJ family transcription regulator
MVMDTLLRVPIITSKRSIKSMRHLARFDEKLRASITKMTKVKYKMAYLEQYMRKEIERRKRKIFEKDKQAIKEQIKKETANKLDPIELYRREKTRQFNLKHLEETTLRPRKALVPWLQLKDATPSTHLNKTLDSVDYSSMDKRVNRDALVDPSKLYLQRLAMTTMEGMIEKQRFIKYDNVWALADRAYVDRQKAMAAERAATSGVVGTGDAGLGGGGEEKDGT